MTNLVDGSLYDLMLARCDFRGFTAGTLTGRFPVVYFDLISRCVPHPAHVAVLGTADSTFCAHVITMLMLLVLFCGTATGYTQPLRLCYSKFWCSLVMPLSPPPHPPHCPPPLSRLCSYLQPCVYSLSTPRICLCDFSRPCVPPCCRPGSHLPGRPHVRADVVGFLQQPRGHRIRGDIARRVRATAPQ